MRNFKNQELKIQIDARMLHSSGIGRCLREIIKEILTVKNNLNIYLYGNISEIESFLTDCDIEYKNVKIIENNSPVYSIKEQITGSLISLKNRGGDIFYFPHYNLPYIVPENSILTIHDFIQFRFPQYFGKNRVRMAKLILNNAVRKVKKIVVVSESTLNDFCEYFPDYKHKACVIYNGISEKFKVLEENKKNDFLKNNELKDFILFVGNNKPHKNINGLIGSFSEIKKEFKNFKLIIISKGFNPDKLGINDDLREDIISLDSVSEDELIYYYNCAHMLVMPSFYEGFGLPVLEAMVCGCPVVTSDLSSLPELGGDAAVYIDPYDVNNIAAAIKELIVDNDLRDKLIEKGIKRAKLFSWKKAASEYLTLFMEHI